MASLRVGELQAVLVFRYTLVQGIDMVDTRGSSLSRVNIYLAQQGEAVKKLKAEMCTGLDDISEHSFTILSERFAILQ